MTTLENIIQEFSTLTGIDTEIVERKRTYRGSWNDNSENIYKVLLVIKQGTIINESDLDILKAGFDLGKLKTATDLANYFGICLPNQ